jgi:hypothetical protein
VHTPLSHWLRLLWGRSPGLHFDSEVPYLSGDAIHLPPAERWREHRAAAAHAAAHLAYSPSRFDGRGLAPIARALLGLLEDARVESLAGRELPGLLRLWLPLHKARPDDGDDFEALMRRLARALADPGYADTHPWVRKGRHLFYLDGAQQVVALRTPAELRHAATRLGHDIGQMRLQFNARLYRPAPDYRDDHRWMWVAEDLAASDPPSPRHGDTNDDPDDAPDEGVTRTRYPEWDRLIARLRPDWCTVLEQAVRPAPRPAAVADADLQPLVQRLRDALRPLARPTAVRRRSADGDVFDLDALVDWRLAQRLRHAPDARVYRGRQCQAARAAVWLLVDQSASTGIAHDGGHTVLQAATRSALALATALRSLGVACAVTGFQSSGRHAVRWRTVKRLDAPVDDGLAARLHALRPGGSTRLGAPLRHATAHLCSARGAVCWVLLLSDGKPHDIDVHDPRYLVDDARHAVRQAARRSVRMACLTLASEVDSDARRIFGRRGAQRVDRLGALPRAVQRLLA